MQQDRRHFAEETGEVILPQGASLKQPSAEASASVQAQTEAGQGEGDLVELPPEDERFRDFFTTTIAVLPKGMHRTADKGTENGDERTEKNSFFSRLGARVRGIFATDTEEEEDDLLGENIFFPEPNAQWKPNPIQKKSEPAQTAPQQMGAETVETLQFDLFAGNPAEVSATAQPEKGTQSVAKPKGKVRFVTEPTAEPKTEKAQPKQEAATAQPSVQRTAEPAKECVAEITPPSVPANVQMGNLLAEDPADALVNALLRERPATAPKTQAQPTLPVEKSKDTTDSAAIPTVDVEELPVQLIPASEADPLPQEPTFEDLSEETEFLREKCEQRTTRRENIFTRAAAKVGDWRDQLMAEHAARQQGKSQEALAQDEAESDMTQEEFFASFMDAPDGAKTTQAPVVQEPSQGEEAQPADFFAATLAAETSKVQAIEPVQTIDPEPMQPASPMPEEQAAVLDQAMQVEPEAAPAEAEEEFDMMFATVQDAFAQRNHQPAPVGANEATIAPLPVQQEEAAQAVVFDTELQASETVQSADLQEIATTAAQPQAMADGFETELSVPEDGAAALFFAPEQDVAAAQGAPEPSLLVERLPEEVSQEEPALEAAALAPCQAQDEDLQAQGIHRGYCLFDQAADEAAADEQLGEIIFVGAAGTAAHSAATAAATAATVSAGASDFFAVLEDEFPEDEAHPTAQGQFEPTQTEAETLHTLGFGSEGKSQSNAPFASHTAAAKEHEPLPQDPEGIEFGLSGMRMRLLIRTVTTAIFAVALFMLGLMAQGILAPVSAIDPFGAPVPFLLVNLVLLLAAAGVSYPVFIDGVTGLWRKPSPDTMPAVATLAALLQLLLCLTLAEEFDPSTTTLFAGLAALALFADAFGSLVMAWVIRDQFSLCTAGVPHYLAYRVTAKDTLRTLTQGVEADDPALLLSRPVQQMESFLEKSFSPRASDRRAQWTAYGLLGAAALSYLIALIAGQGFIGCISSFAAVLCVGAPLSVTLISALPSVCLQRAAAKVGAVVPGWQSMEALGDINLLAVEAKDLFPPLCAQLHGIKTFQKERVDLAILYATSILIEGCDTLQNLFAGMIEYKKDMLYPVKDLVVRQGEGFVGWCENYRVILGTRALMEAEGVNLPLMDYENRYSKDGKRQVLYLAVSGQLYAMFLLSYRGEKGIARALRTLRKEQIRLLVHTTDPTLTAARIEQTYHLPKGYITLMSVRQGAALESATDYRPQADGCMVHLGNFTSVVGGLKAASAAVQAEQSASAIQLIWAGFSILLCLFLAITGGLAQVALVAILLYQVAWSVLTLGVVLTKKFE